MSFLSLRLKHEKRTLRCEGLKPSTMEGMERSRSARENRISSLLYRRKLNLKAKLESSQPHLIFKHLVLGDFNLGLIGSTCTAVPC
jgi:hypothetical protein